MQQAFDQPAPDETRSTGQKDTLVPESDVRQAGSRFFQVTLGKLHPKAQIFRAAAAASELVDGASKLIRSFSMTNGRCCTWV